MATGYHGNNYLTTTVTHSHLLYSHIKRKSQYGIATLVHFSDSKVPLLV